MTDLMSPSRSRRFSRRHQAVDKFLPIGVLANQRNTPAAILRYPIHIPLVLVGFLIPALESNIAP